MIDFDPKRIVVQFRAGHPEVADRGIFKMVRDSNRMVEGTPGAAIHAAVALKDGDVVVTRRRVGPSRVPIST